MPLFQPLIPLATRHKKYREISGGGKHGGIRSPHGPGTHNPYDLDLLFSHFTVHFFNEIQPLTRNCQKGSSSMEAP
jgi:hypothetical protein